MRRDRYTHRQTSLAPALVMVGIYAVLLVLAVLLSGGFNPGLIIVAAIFTLVVLLRLAWATMETSVDSGELRAAFRPFGPRRTIATDDIVSHEVTSLTWLHGLGGVQRVHLRGAWAYSVWGRSAVAIRYRHPRRGERALIIGTDDVDGLDAALTAARGPTRRR